MVESDDALSQTKYSQSVLLLLFIIWHHQRHNFYAVWALRNTDKKIRFLLEMEDNKLISNVTKRGQDGCKRGRGVSVGGGLKPVHSMREQCFLNKECCTGWKWVWLGIVWCRRQCWSLGPDRKDGPCCWYTVAEGAERGTDGTYLLASEV